MSLTAGFCVRAIDVPVGTPMAGFAARLDASSGVHDPTTVCAAVVGRWAVVAIDVCTLHEQTCRTITAELAGVVDDVVVCATHTHAGPAIGRGRAGGHDPAIHDEIVLAAVDAVRTAATVQVPVTVNWTQVRGLGVAKNRRHPDRTIDPPLTALRFHDEHDGVVGVLVSYPCHPVVLDGKNTLISGDYPTFLRDEVASFYPGAMVMFLCGAAGDVNTGHRPEDSYRPDGNSLRTFTEARRIGRHLGVGLDRAQWEPVIGSDAWFTSTPVALPYARLDPESVAREVREWADRAACCPHEELGLWLSWRRWAETWEPADPPFWSGRVSVLGIGDARLVFLPGEPFLQTADEISRDRATKHLILGYADGVPGYLPPEAEYPHGGYEVADSHRYYGAPGPFAPGSAEILRDAARTMLD